MGVYGLHPVKVLEGCLSRCSLGRLLCGALARELPAPHLHRALKLGGMGGATGGCIGGEASGRMSIGMLSEWVIVYLCTQKHIHESTYSKPSLSQYSGLQNYSFSLTCTKIDLNKCEISLLRGSIGLGGPIELTFEVEESSLVLGHQLTDRVLERDGGLWGGRTTSLDIWHLFAIFIGFF